MDVKTNDMKEKAEKSWLEAVMVFLKRASTNIGRYRRPLERWDGKIARKGDDAVLFLLRVRDGTYCVVATV